ncbi:MAG: 50S ribosomal protein L5 [Nanoarchaeota archaeon]
MNPMRQIRIEKLTLNIGAGKEQSILTKGMKLLEQITEIPPVKTITNKRIAAWGLRPGLPIGCKITLRGKKAQEIFSRLVGAKENILQLSNFDNYGNISFGIHEYIDIPQVKYDPEIGIIGLQVCLTLERPGFRIKKRKISKRKIRPSHKITQQDAIEYLKQEFHVKIAEEAS